MTILYAQSSLLLLETNIDDMNPELFPPLLSDLLEAGAKDCWITPIVMKHGRPASTLSVLSEETQRADLLRLIFRETTTLGIRIQSVERVELNREQLLVDTPYGNVGMKLGKNLQGEILNAAPEYRDCERLSRETGTPRKEVYKAAEASYRLQQGKLKD